MATFANKHIIDTIIENDGYYPDDPRVVKIVEYDTPEGQTVWGVVWEIEPVERQDRYEIPTQYVNNPRVIWSI